MTGSMAIGGYNQFGYDPYLMAALQSYNPNAQVQQTKQTEQRQETKQKEETQETTTTQQKGTKSNAGLVLCGIAAVGAGALLYKAHKKGGDKGIREGFKQIWKGLTGKAGKEQKQVFQMRQQANGKWYCNIPGRKQVVTRDEASALGHEISDEMIKLGNEGTQLKVIEFTHKNNTFRVKGDGTVLKYTNKNGESQIGKFTNPTAQEDIEYKNTISKIIEQLKKGEKVDGVETKMQYYTHTGKDGLTRRFLQKQNETQLKEINPMTTRFGINSDAVKAYRARNPKVDEALKQVNSGKIPEGLSIASAEYQVDSTNTLIIKNGEVAGIKIEGKYYSKNSDKYVAWEYENPKVIKDVENLRKDNKLNNIVYAAA